jgi:hypothetical protein
LVDFPQLVFAFLWLSRLAHQRHTNPPFRQCLTFPSGVAEGFLPAISHRIDSVLYKQLPSVAVGHFRRRCCCPLSTVGVCGN